MERWSEVLARQECHNDALREAERDRLVLHELALQAKGDRFHRRVMTWLGCGLVSWGGRLQEHFPARVEARATK